MQINGMTKAAAERAFQSAHNTVKNLAAALETATGRERIAHLTSELKFAREFRQFRLMQVKSFG